jgi:hypothetical protein
VQHLYRLDPGKDVKLDFGDKVKNRVLRISGAVLFRAFVKIVPFCICFLTT